MPTKKKSSKSTAVATVDVTEFPVLAQSGGAREVVQSLQDLGIGRFDLSKVTVPSGGAVAFEIEALEGVEYEKEIDVVVAFARSNQRAWYREAIEDSDGNSPPDCSSEDGLTGHGVITEEAVDGEVAERHECAECPWNQWESARSGSGKGRDCSEYMTLFAFGKNSLVPFVIQVPPTSLKAARKYSLQLLGAGKKMGAVVTTLSLEKKENPTPHSVIQFTYGGELPEAAQKSMADMEADLRKAFAGSMAAGDMRAGARDVESEEID